jgi:TRAP-type C4-dicarboxylate transport system substrate-binding protein
MKEAVMRFRAVALAVIAAAFVATAAPAQTYPEIRLRQNNITPATVGSAKATLFFAEELSKRSGGKITIENLWSGAGGAPAELLKLVGGGALDIGAFPGSYFPAQMPFLASFSALPLVLPTSPKAQAIANALWEKVPAFQAEARTNKLYPLFFQVLNEYHLLCTQPVRTLADLRNKKIRSQGEYFPLAVRAIDAVPVTVLPGEFYEALQRGTVDCMLLPWDLLAANRLHEVAKFGSDISFGTLVGHGVFYNADKWNSFSPDVKKLFADIAKEAQVLDLQAIAESEGKAVETMKAGGMQLIEFQDKAAFRSKMPDFLAVWQKRMDEAGKGADAAKTVEIWRSMM